MSKYTRSLFFALFVLGSGIGPLSADGGGVGASGGGGSSGGGAMGGGAAPTKPKSTTTDAATSEADDDSGGSSDAGNDTTTATDTTTTTTTTPSEPTPEPQAATTPPPPPPPAPEPDAQSSVEIINISETPSAAYNHTVSSIELNISGAEAVINGSGFGGGPNIVLYDTFDNGGSNGDEVPLKNTNNPACSTDTFGLDVSAAPGPTIGCWTSYGDNHPLYNGIAHSGTHSMQGYGGAQRKLEIDFPNSTEVFVSFWTHIPPGSYFPGRWWETDHPGGPELETFPQDSAWKMAWLEQDRNYGSYFMNIIVPNVVAGDFLINGNSHDVSGVGQGRDFWSWNHFNRMSTWLKADPGNLLGPGEVIFQAMSEDKGFYQASINSKPIFVDKGVPPAGHPDAGTAPTPDQKYLNHLVIPGWINENSADVPGSHKGSKVTNVLYDDIYLAIGPNAVSRVELSDSPTYLGTSKVKIMLPVTWSNNQIRITLSQLEGVDIKNSYLYIIDKDGDFNPNGYPLQ